MHPHDVGMVQSGGGLSFEVESGEIGRVVDPRLRQHFDRHAAVHQDVLGQINAAHAAGANVAQQLVLAEEEALVSPFEQIVALPAGEETGGDQCSGKEIGVFQLFGSRPRTYVEQRVVQLIGFDQLATFCRFNEFFDGYFGHDCGRLRHLFERTSLIWQVGPWKNRTQGVKTHRHPEWHAAPCPAAQPSTPPPRQP